jgi:hypothetical protein
MTPESLDEIVWIDFEFISNPGERPKVICVVAAEQRNGRTVRKWLESDNTGIPPFRTGPRVLTVAYFASAEWGCYLKLGWPLPRLTLDLYAEFRVRTNGLPLPHGRGLLGAMQWYGLDGIEASRKEYIRKRILAGGPYSKEDRENILSYCQSDVEGLAQLYSRMIGDKTNLIQALWRGEYMKVVATAEYNGVPVDKPLYDLIVEHWPALQSEVIERVNATIPVFENGHFRASRFREWLQQQHMRDEWPITTTGGLALDEDTFRDAAARFPQIEPLWRARQMLGQMHKPNLYIGADGRNRCLLSPYATKTGRNAPSTTKFIFGMPAYFRGLIRPEPGKALAYVDWEQRELSVAVRRLKAVALGDPVMPVADGFFG